MKSELYVAAGIENEWFLGHCSVSRGPLRSSVTEVIKSAPGPGSWVRGKVGGEHLLGSEKRYCN